MLGSLTVYVVIDLSGSFFDTDIFDRLLTHSCSQAMFSSFGSLACNAVFQLLLDLSTSTLCSSLSDNSTSMLFFLSDGSLVLLAVFSWVWLI